MPITKFTDLAVYEISEDVAMEIFEITKSFPKEEKYSLTDQIRRSSRSVAANIAEGWGKRNYENLFKRHLIDATGSLEETKSWLRFSKNCNYISEDQFDSLWTSLDQLGGKLFNLHRNWKS